MEQAQKDKHQFAAAFLAVQAVFLLCLLIYYNESITLAVLSGVLLWSFASLALATLLVRPRILISGSRQPGHESGESGNTYIFGLPGKNLDLAGICSIMQEGVVLLKHGHVIYVNPALSYLLAAHEDEILGTRISAYIHPEDTGLINLDNGGGNGLSRATLRLITHLGDVRWVICSTHNVDWQGEEAVLLLLENIGPLRQAQHSLEELEHQSRILFERTPLGIAMFDSMGQLKLSNTAWNVIWSSIVGNGGRRFNILQDPFLPNTVVEKAVNQAFNGKDANISNFEHSAPWGETRWLNLNFHPMLDPMGKLIGVSMIQQDITDTIRSSRRENELNDQLTSLRNELAYSESFLTQLQDRAKHVIINFEPDGTISGWNRHAETRFALPAVKVLGTSYKHLTSDMLAPYAAIIQRALEAERPNIQERLERHDASGPHYEKIRLYSAKMGFSSIIILEIKDITLHIFSTTMRSILGRFASLSGISHALEEVMELHSVAPALKPGSGVAEKYGELSETLKFLSEQEWPSSSRRGIAIGELLASTADGLPAKAPGSLPLETEYADTALEIFTDPTLAASGLLGLGKALLTLPGANHAALKLRQSRESLHGVITLEVQAADSLGLTDLPSLMAENDGRISGLEESSNIRALLKPILYIAACDGIVGAYSTDGNSGFVCRFPLSGENTPPENK